MRKHAIRTFILATMLSLSACTANIVTPEPDEISLRLKWLHGVQFAGFYVAEEKGFFEEENLSVTLNEGGLDFDEMTLVSTGQDDFGIVGGPQIVIARSEGVPIKAVATIFQISPSVYFALKESGIEGPEDFIGRRVVINPNDLKLPIMFDKLGLDIDRVNGVPPSSDLETFYRGEGEVWTGYITNQVVRARLDGYELNVIFPSDYGIHEYGDCLITTDEMIEENPELVERFLRAALRGWRYAIENPAEAAVVTSHYSESPDEVFLSASMEVQIPLIHPGDHNVGWMRVDVWEGMHDLLMDQGLVEKPVDLDTVFSMKFLLQVYGAQE